MFAKTDLTLFLVGLLAQLRQTAALSGDTYIKIVMARLHAGADIHSGHGIGLTIRFGI